MNGEQDPEPKTRYRLVRAGDLLELAEGVNRELRRDERTVVVGGPCVTPAGGWVQAVLVQVYE